MQKLFRKAVLFIALFCGLWFASILIYSLIYPPQSSAHLGGNELVTAMQTAVNKEAYYSKSTMAWAVNDTLQFSFNYKKNTVVIHTPKDTFALDLDRITAQDSLGYPFQLWQHNHQWITAPMEMDKPYYSRIKVQAKTKKETGLYLIPKKDSTDTQLWIFDNSNLPIMQQWINKPYDKANFVTWQKWETLPSGLKVATLHQLGDSTVTISRLRQFNES